MSMLSKPLGIMASLSLAIAFLGATGCGNEEGDFTKARETNTVEGYEAYVAKYPNSSHATEVRSALAEMEWKLARQDDRAVTYEEYIQKYPETDHAVEARNLLQQVVMLPYLAFMGNASDSPPLEKLTLPRDKLAQNPGLTKTSVIGTASSSGFFLNGKFFRISGEIKYGEPWEPVDIDGLGKLTFSYATSSLGKSGPIAIFYIGTTRSQRDRILESLERSSP